MTEEQFEKRATKFMKQFSDIIKQTVKKDGNPKDDFELLLTCLANIIHGVLLAFINGNNEDRKRAFEAFCEQVIESINSFHDPDKNIH